MIPLSKGMAGVLVAVAVTGTARADEEVYKRALPSTVMVINLAEEHMSTGSGALVDGQRKLVVTNYHVVGRSAEVAVVFPAYDRARNLIAERTAYFDDLKGLRRNGRLVKGRVAVRDPQRDLALIELEEVPADARALPLAPESLKPGQRVHSIGNPGASDAMWLYTRGTVRQVYRRTFRVDDDLVVRARVVETDSAVNPGDSGGPVVNDRGELAAIVESNYTGKPGREVRLISTFIDISEVKALLERYTQESYSPALKN